MAKKKFPADMLKFFQKTGAEGGKKRAEIHSKEQLSKWGKLGGRPKKDANRDKEKA
jgi:hypothetical protein